MKIKPVFPRKRAPGGMATKALVEITEKDAVILASLLSYARRAGMDSLDNNERRRAEKMLAQLAAVCESLDADANAYLETHGPDYFAIRKAMDPEWETSA